MGDERLAEMRAGLLGAVGNAVLTAEGDLDPGLRAAAFAHAAKAAGAGSSESWTAGGVVAGVADAMPLPEPLGAFVDKVARNAYKVVDADVEALREAGFSEDATFEAVLATAVGAGLSRLEIGMAALAGRR